MRVLLSAFIGSKNLGDEAIFAVLSEMIPNLLGADLTVLSIDLEKTRGHNLAEGTEVVEASVPNFVKYLRRSDALLMGGGGIIQDESSVINLLYYAMQTWVARVLLRKQVFLVFVGVGPVTSRFGHWLLRRMANKISYSLVRDQESVDMLVDHGFRAENIALAFDPVYNLPVSDDLTVSSGIDGDYILFCPRDWFFTKRYLPTRFALTQGKKDESSDLMAFRRELVVLVRRTLENHPDLSILGIPFFLSQDAELLSWIRSQLPAELQARLVIKPEYISPEEYVVLAKGSVGVLGMRLHSLILGALSNRPMVPLIYSSKVRSMVAYLGLKGHSTELRAPKFDVDATLVNLERSLGETTHPYSAPLEHIADTNRAAAAEFFTTVRAKIESSAR